MCGTTQWKAVKATSKTTKNLDETGLVVACCCHTLALKAVNMFHGKLLAFMNIFLCINYCTLGDADLATLTIYTPGTCVKKCEVYVA